MGDMQFKGGINDGHIINNTVIFRIHNRPPTSIRVVNKMLPKHPHRTQSHMPHMDIGASTKLFLCFCAAKLKRTASFADQVFTISNTILQESLNPHIFTFNTFILGFVSTIKAAMKGRHIHIQ